jgi:hypothetical protein
MNLEDRLRNHYTDRATREPLAPPRDPPTHLRATNTHNHRNRWLIAAAIALVAAITTATTIALTDNDTTRVEIRPPDTTIVTPTTTIPTTPTTTLPDNTDVRSVVVSIDGVLGGWNGSEWFATDDDVAPARSGDQYRIVGLDQPITTATGGAPVALPCNGSTNWRVDVGLGTFGRSLEPAAVAVSGIALPQPRPVALLPTDDETAFAAARDVFSSLGRDVPEPQLAQVIRADLDGDGADEIIVVADRLEGTADLDAEPGDYSLVFVRYTGLGRTTVLWDRIAETVSDGSEPATWLVVERIGAVADLNGDGRMELVAQQDYFDGFATAVLEQAGEEFVTRISVGCAG